MKQTLQERFEDYHKKYPLVYENFKQWTLEAIRLGHTRFSARGIFQVMRFKAGGKIKDDGFKYNNNYTPYYVRMFEKDYPKLNGFFEKRTLKSA